jgi:hypothetical protein
MAAASLLACGPAMGSIIASTPLVPGPGSTASWPSRAKPGMAMSCGRATRDRIHGDSRIGGIIVVV